jgi:hypothetical protein
MAIKITDSVITDKGASTELYINIESVDYNKSQKTMSVSTNVYFSESSRNLNDRDKVMTFVIKQHYTFDYLNEELDSNAFGVAYTKLKNKLEEKFNTEEI